MQSGLMENELRIMIAIAIAVLLVVALVGTIIVKIILRSEKERDRKYEEELELLNRKNEIAQRMFDTTRKLSRHQRLETMGVIASSVNHEFSNLLTPIMGYSLLAMEKVPEGNDELMDDLEHVYESANKAKEMVSWLLKMSRKSSDEEYRCFSPDKLMETVENLLQPSCPENVTITRDYNCPDECLCANETQISQAIMNIVINAFQALAKKGGNVHIATRLADENVEISVTDNGPGISEEDLKHIREAFFTTKESDEGTGLGIPIVEQILAMYNGRLIIDSEPGKGSTFVLQIPANQQQEQNADE